MDIRISAFSVGAVYPSPTEEAGRRCAAQPPRTDKNQLEPGWEDRVDWGRAVQEAWLVLQRDFPQVRFVVAEPEDRFALEALAAQGGTGACLVVSGSFLSAMAQGAEACAAGQDILRGTAALLQSQWDGEHGVGAYLDRDSLTFWTVQTGTRQEEEKLPSLREQKEQEQNSLLDWMKKAREASQAAAKKRSSQAMARVLRSAGMSATGVYGRLARARTTQQVKSASYGAGLAASKVRAAMSQAESGDREKLRVILRQMQGARSQARRKIAALEQEAELRRRQKRARERKAALRLKEALAKRKAARQSGEHLLVVKALRGDMALLELRRKYLMQLIGGSGETAGTTAVSPAGEGTGQAPVQAPVQAAGGGTVQVAFSQPVAIQLPGV